MKTFALVGTCLLVLFIPLAVSAQVDDAGILIDDVWSGHPVGFDILTERGHQFIAYYDADRRLTVIGRKLNEAGFTRVQPEGVPVPRRKRMSNVLGWDSHNSLKMALDREGYLHLSGNMHADPLVYYRTREPFDVSTLERVDRMTGKRETQVTYPHFFKNVEGDLLFRYRDGGSGRGSDYYNIYDLERQEWSRLIEGSLIDGEGQRNAYSSGPVRSSDGSYHMIWMWRDTPDAATNHTLSYAHSRDLVHWQTSAGEALELPITIQTGEVIDAAAPGEGLINMCFNIGFDAQNRPIVSYHRYDAEGQSQAYVARPDGAGAWLIRSLSEWEFRWGFSGGGSIVGEVRLGAPVLTDEGVMMLSYSTKAAGRGYWYFESDSLERLPPPTREPEASEPKVALNYTGSDSPGMQSKSMSSVSEEGHWILRWETLGRNRDHPREVIPPPAELRLYHID
tara:strand:+ start:193 stop:1545 length:1353 start_codon:yes stop_codon:yes gene_type:complete